MLRVSKISSPASFLPELVANGGDHVETWMKLRRRIPVNVLAFTVISDRADSKKQ